MLDLSVSQLTSSSCTKVGSENTGKSWTCYRLDHVGFVGPSFSNSSSDGMAALKTCLSRADKTNNKLRRAPGAMGFGFECWLSWCSCVAAS